MCVCVCGWVGGTNAADTAHARMHAHTHARTPRQLCEPVAAEDQLLQALQVEHRHVLKAAAAPDQDGQFGTPARAATHDSGQPIPQLGIAAQVQKFQFGCRAQQIGRQSGLIEAVSAQVKVSQAGQQVQCVRGEAVNLVQRQNEACRVAWNAAGKDTQAGPPTVDRRAGAAAPGNAAHVRGEVGNVDAVTQHRRRLDIRFPRFLWSPSGHDGRYPFDVRRGSVE